MGAEHAGLFKSPLHDRHVALGAKFAEFGGWSMPLEYAGTVKEHTAVRTAVGIFDVSHLGKAVVRGAGAAAYVNSCLTNDLNRIGAGRAQYTLCCRSDGGVQDDLIQYLRGEDEVFLIPNAANTEEVVRRLAADAPAGVEVANQHHDYAIVAVQGADSDAVLAAGGFPVGHDYMSFVEMEHGGAPVVVCRTGYTGERGYELVVPNAAAGSVWDALLAAGEDHGMVPCGLGARDTLRTEMGYPLHGQDISTDVTPVQARLGWAVGWDKPTFWGRAALVAERSAKPARLLRGLVAVGRGIPRPHMSVSTPDGSPVGLVTSGTFSPTRRQGVGLALLDRAVHDGDEVHVDVRGRAEPFKVTKPPFVTPGVRNPAA
ncbi:MAG TPA: glycine cleavage system aminomethyltransferase GcvT [Nocardioidaceae bacterium]|nr:glycine cleavage system aminomethyltransferase GcvT [Nocardioidaceae bacterium]